LCCDAGRAILYVGIEERGAVHFEVRDAPEGEAALPTEVSGTYRRLIEAVEAALRRGVQEEDLSRGHVLLSDPAARAVQDMLPALARENLPILRQVIKDSADETQRAAALTILAYNPRKTEIVNDLQSALRDNDPGVRATAVRSLEALAVYQRLNPS